MSNEDRLRDYLKRVTADLQQTRQRLIEAESRDREPVAIIGLSCRYPGGVDSPEAFWRLLATGADGIGPFPQDRGWAIEAEPGYRPEGGFAGDVAGFDAAFFGISPREALAMDPQQRLLLEASWEAVESAGLDPAALHGSQTGVFAGVSSHEYNSLVLGNPAAGLEGYLLTGSSFSVVSGRVAYALGLTGPAVSVDTACSSSLVALHLAVQALRNGECGMALVGGVTVMATPGTFAEFTRQGGMAGDGRCKSYAAAADGTGWSEGVGVLLVERLADARRLGHRVLGVVRGSAVNQDGASNGLTAPNGPSQERVILQALANARVRASEVDLVEGHGTGTKLGDPIEAQALLATYGQNRTDGPLRLGSVKSNIGHTQAAAGVAGVIKAVLALGHESMPKSLHVDEPTPQVDWSFGGVALLTEACDWPRDAQRPRRAGVSSFGISGTNAHVIIEEGDAEPGPVPALPVPEGGVAWTISAKTRGALRGQASRLARWAEEGEDGLVETALALAARPRFAHRAAVLGADRAALVEGLRSVAAGAPGADACTGVSAVSASGPGGVFVFPGQGWQRAGLCAGLLAAGGRFAEVVGECGAALGQWVDFDLLDVLTGTEETWLERVDVVQPVLWAVMVGLARTWQDAGCAASAVLGHSQGEIAAAVIAGALSVQEGARVVAVRSRVLREVLAGSGGMVSVAAPAADVEDWIAAKGLTGLVSVAAVNGPGAVTVSGEREPVLAFAARLEERGVRVRVLGVDYASHSPMVERVHEVLRRELAGLAPAPTNGVGWLSTVTGQWMRGDEADAEYWYRNLREPVAFAPAVARLAEAGHGVFVEASGHPVLTSGIEQVMEERGVVGTVITGTLRRDTGDRAGLLASAAKLYTRGVAIDWAALPPAAARPAGPAVSVPGYAFEHARYWLDVPADPVGDFGAVGLSATGHPLVGASVALADGGVLLTGCLSLAAQPWLAGSAEAAAAGVALLPDAGLLDLALRAGEVSGCGALRALTVHAPLVVPEQGGLQLQVTAAAPGPDGSRELAVHTRPDDGQDAGEWTRHASGVIAPGGIADERPAEASRPWPPLDAVEVPSDALHRAWRSETELFAEIDAAGRTPGHAVLDAAVHAYGLLLGGGQSEPGEAIVLAAEYAEAAFARSEAAALRVHVRVGDSEDGGSAGLAVSAFTDDGTPVATIGSLTLRPTPLDALRKLDAASARGALYRTEWVPVAPAAAAPARAVRPQYVVCETVEAAVDAVRRGPASDEESVLVIVPRGERIPAVWGRMRAEQAANPGTFILLDTDTDTDSGTDTDTDTDADADLDARILAAGEECLVLRDGRLFAPRLVAAAPAAPSEDTGWPWPAIADGTVLLFTDAPNGPSGPLARHLVAQHGVSNLLILHAAAGEAADGSIREPAEPGTQAKVVTVDPEDRDALARAIEEIPAERPLSAVIHVGSSATSAAAQHLHELTAGRPLAAFVLCSDAFGPAATQAEALASLRWQQALPGLALTWGRPWAHGDAASTTVPLDDEALLALFDTAVTAASADPATPPLVLARFDLRGLRAREAAGAPVPHILRDLIRAAEPRRGNAAPGAPEAAAETSVAALRRALTDAADAPEQQLDLLLELVRNQAAAVLRHESADPIDTDKPFRELGFDSLTAVDMRNRLAETLGVALPTTVLFDHPSPLELAAFLRDRLAQAAGGAARAVIVQAAAVADEPIAIVGMACRLPGAVDGPEAFWRLLTERTDAIGPFPADRGWPQPSAAEPAGYRPEGGFLHEASGFDAGFFGISPREALAMDPQQRVVLEAAWEACEHAGFDPADLRGSQTGVFLGAGSTEYAALLAANPSAGSEGYVMTGNVSSVLSGRISYVMGLTGPAITVDTACSSSLVALHWAAQALRNGECSMALAGGVTVMATPGMFNEFARQGGLAADARCKAYAGAADGTSWGEGVGVLVVERLSDARRLGHRVLGLLRGSAVNQDGASNGLTAPNGPSQERVILQALANAGVGAADVDLVEGHGTGTRLGDPIEAQALLATYGAERRNGPVRLGSVKSNIGHAQAAAGVAGVIKTLLAMRHETMPATLHVDEPSPAVDWTEGAVELLTEARPWPRDAARPRLAGISSFGISGTNAHVIVEEGDPEPEAAEPLPAPPGGVAWVLSAKSEGALRAQAARIAEWADAGEDGLVETAAALAARPRHPYRAAAVGADRASLLAQLQGIVAGGGGGTAVSGPVAVLFSGQGSQRVGMGLGLRDELPIFTEVFDEVCGLLGLPLDVVSDAEALNRTEVTQPALFAVQVAAYRQLEAWGVSAGWLGGHSIGELTAAYLAGVWDLPGACRIVAARGRLMGCARAGGAMAALEASEAQVLEDLTEGVGIAAVNGPTSIVVSGDADAVDALVESYKQAGRRARRLTVSHAFHSHHMDEVLAEFEEIVASVPASAPRVKLVSTLTGTELTDEATQPSYWVRQVREAVRFADAVSFLTEQGTNVYLDISPDGVLTSMITGVLPEARVVPTLRKDIDEPRALLQAAAALYTAGVGIGWPTVLGTEAVRPTVVPPSYAFEHTRYWIDLPPRTAQADGTSQVDRDFWDLVASADIGGVAETLGAAEAEERALADVVPLLARWRGRGRLARSRYQVDWELQRGLPSPQAPVPPLAGSWLLVTSPQVAPGLADALHTALSAHAPQLKTVDLETCEAWSAEQWTAFDGVLSLLGCAGDTSAEAEPGVSVGVAETLRLLTACTAAAGSAAEGPGSSPPARVWVLTRGGTDAPGGAEPDPWSWQLWGLGRVAALDCPSIWGGLIDLPAQPAAEDAAARLVHVLADGTRDQVALRPDGVWSARLVRAPEPPPGTPDPWRARGTVLVTGAGGALGGRVARWAAEHGAQRVVLASRRGEQAPGSAELAADLRELGAEALFVACDVSERAQVRDLLTRCGDELASVFHIAGAPGLTPLAGPDAVTDPAGWSRIAAGKAAGAWWLDRELGDRELDAFVVFSSIAGVWGSGAQGAYAAANAFLDGLMSARRSAARGLASGTAIAWGPWAGGGMAQGETGEYLAKRGLRTLDPDLALAALEQALTGRPDRAGTVVADVDWSVFAPAFTLTRPAPLLEGVPEAAAALEQQARAADAAAGEADGALAARIAELSAEDGRRELLELVRTQAALVLGHASTAAIGADGAFNDLGFDSLTAVELRNLLGRATGLALPPTLVFDHPNPAAVAEFLRGALLPEALDPADEALARLGRLESALGELAEDDPARELVIRRLQATLAGLSGAGGRGPGSPARRGAPAAAAATADRLRSAGSDELFDFIDKQLGRSK